MDLRHRYHRYHSTNRAISAALFLLLVFSALSSLAEQAEWTGKIVGVKDGDTIEVMREGRAVTIRLSGIDAPEKGQAFGQAAKHLASDLCFGKTVAVKAAGTDKYGRTLAQIILLDGRNLEREMVRQGFAWHYKKYSSDAHLAALEDEARQAKRGLWADANPIPPWDWRHARQSNNDPPVKSVSAPNAKAVRQAGSYHGNTKSHVFHRPSCRYYDCANCIAVFSSREEAIQAGYQPCKICNP